MAFDKFKANHDGQGPFAKAYDALTAGEGILGRRGLRRERELTDSMIDLTRSDAEIAGLDSFLSIGATRMTREQHHAYRAALSERVGGQRTANEAFAVLNKQLDMLTPANDDDRQQIALMRSGLEFSQAYTRSENPDLQRQGLMDLMQMKNGIQDFAANNEKQRIEREGIERAVGSETWQRFTGLADDYRTETSKIRGRQEAFGIMQAASFSPDRAGDVARINAFMHMIEPNSIVMPGEAANVAGYNGVPEFLVTAISRLENEGAPLTASDRKGLDTFARSLMVQSNKDLGEINRRYAAQARGGDVPDALARTMFLDAKDAGLTGQENFDTKSSAAPQQSSGVMPSRGDVNPQATAPDSKAYSAGEAFTDFLGTMVQGGVDFTKGAVGYRPPPQEYVPPTKVQGVIKRPTDEYNSARDEFRRKAGLVLP